MAARRGIGLTRKQILSKTHVLCQKKKISSAYTSFNAGKDWWEGVKRRHPDLVIRKPEKLTSTRARMMKKEVINMYFTDLGTIMEGLNLQNKPHLIWNCDEMGKNFEHNPVRVVAEKGEKMCVSKTSSKSNNMTIMACVNASGRRMPPMFITKGKTSRSLHGFNTTGAPIGTRWCWQQNGWMDDVIGERWFTEIFIENCGAERPQLLILDGHSSHETLSILMKAMDENIHIIALPPHTTHALQPLDKAVFGPLNRAYNDVCSAYLQGSTLHQINKWSFPSLFRQAWDTAVTGANIRSGFRACGIYPLDRAAIPEKVFGPSEPTDKPLAASHSPLHSERDNQNSNMHTSFEESTRGFAFTSPNISTLESSLDEGQLTASSSPVNNSQDPYISGSTEQYELLVDMPDITTVKEVLSEVDIQTQSDVLDVDLSDPSQLLRLISEGNVVVNDLYDENGKQVVIEPDRSPMAESLPIVENEKCNDQVDTSAKEIEAFFIPPVANLQSKKKLNRRTITHHRLLTSEEIISEKIRNENIKIEKDKKKRAKAESKTKSNKKVKIEKN